MRVLYQAEVRDQPIADAASAVFAEAPDEAAVVAHARALVDAVARHKPEIDSRLAGAAEHWTLGRMAVIDRCVLRMATAELMAFADLDAPIIIDEAVSVADEYGTDASGGFVNGILDRVARELRPQWRRGSGR